MTASTENTVIVTGGCGFIGMHLCLELQRAGFKVISIDNLVPSYYPNLSIYRKKELELSGIENFNLDISEFDSNLKLLELCPNPLAIIHLAAWPGVLPSFKYPNLYGRNNVMATINIAEYAKQSRVPKVIYASSSSVYGSMSQELKARNEEEILPPPLNFYAATKQMSEAVFDSYPELFGKVCGLRFFTVIGSFGRPDMAYWTFANQIQAKQPILLRGENGGIRDFSSVKDVVKTIRVILSLNSMPPKMNVSSGNPISTLDLVESISERLRIKPIIEIVDRSKTEADVTWGATNNRISHVGDWRWSSVEEMSDEFITWFENHQFREI